MISPVIKVDVISVVHIRVLRFVEITFACLDLQADKLPTWVASLHKFNMGVDPHVRNGLLPENPLELVHYDRFHGVDAGPLCRAIATHGWLD